MSPRRSSRARSSQHPPSTIPHTNSSSSLNSTNKDNRNARSINNGQAHAASPRQTSTVRSESIDDADSLSRGANLAESTLAQRRSRRGNDGDNKENATKTEQFDEEEIDEDAVIEDVTRCICGQAEYPGPGASVKEQLNTNEPLSDDVGNFFVQCDMCQVWQHGGCMGLTDESMLPDEYYCEHCKPTFHKIMKNINGLKSSRYLPIIEEGSSRSSPLSSTEAPRKGSGKHKPLEMTKRRATMNSRSAYDEDEALRRAIEESTHTGPLKRAREDTDDPRPAMKRQRTGSSMSSESRHSQSPAPTTEEGLARLMANGGKSANKLRGAAAKNNREKEIRDKQKEQVAAQRAEAATKRNARSERRRVEDSPPPTPTLSPSKVASHLVANPKPKADTPPSGKAALSRKGGRPPARRGRLGRNQYTRDLPLNGETSDSPMRDIPYDHNGADSPRPHTNGNINGESGKSSKAKTHSARTSMNEMKRRVAAILEFVGRMQTDRETGPTTQAKTSSSDGGRPSGSSGTNSLKGNSTPNGINGSTLPTASLVKAVTQGLEEASEIQKQAQSSIGDGDHDRDAANSGGVPSMDIKPEKEFETMNANEMMENLTKELVAWQQLYGIYAR